MTFRRAELPIVLVVLKHRAPRPRGASHPPEKGGGKKEEKKKEGKEREKEKKGKKPTLCASSSSLCKFVNPMSLCLD